VLYQEAKYFTILDKFPHTILSILFFMEIEVSSSWQGMVGSQFKVKDTVSIYRRKLGERGG
jgi:hypothetical protein